MSIPPLRPLHNLAAATPTLHPSGAQTKRICTAHKPLACARHRTNEKTCHHAVRPSEPISSMPQSSNTLGNAVWPSRAERVQSQGTPNAPRTANRGSSSVAPTEAQSTWPAHTSIIRSRAVAMSRSSRTVCPAHKMTSTGATVCRPLPRSVHESSLCRHQALPEPLHPGVGQ